MFYYNSARIDLGLFQEDVNVIWDVAVHDLAILDYLLKERPSSVSANGTGHIRRSHENMAHLTLFYPTNTVAHLNVNWLAPVKMRQVRIGGSRRMIVYNDLEPSEKVKVYDRGVMVGDSNPSLEDRISYRSGDMWAPQLSVKEALLLEMEKFVDCIAHGAEPISSGESGLLVVEMLECAAISLCQRGHPIPYDNWTPYGAAKAFREELLRSLNEMSGLDYVALRYLGNRPARGQCRRYGSGRHRRSSDRRSSTTHVSRGKPGQGLERSRGEASNVNYRQFGPSAYRHCLCPGERL